jgi:hypothetical protein
MHLGLSFDATPAGAKTAAVAAPRWFSSASHFERRKHKVTLVRVDIKVVQSFPFESLVSN